MSSTVCMCTWLAVASGASQCISCHMHVVECGTWVIASVVVCTLWPMWKTSDGFCCCIYRVWNLWNKDESIIRREPLPCFVQKERMSKTIGSLSMHIRKACVHVVNLVTHLCFNFEWRLFVNCWLWESALLSVWFYFKLPALWTKAILLSFVCGPYIK